MINLKRIYKDITESSSDLVLDSLSKKIMSLKSPLDFVDEYMNDAEIDELLRIMDTTEVSLPKTEILRVLLLHLPARHLESAHYI